MNEERLHSQNTVLEGSIRRKPQTYNFVLCPSYHGATLLSCLLNNHSEITALGDLVPIGRLLDRAMCGCGQLVKDCDFWKTIASRVNPSNEYRDDQLLPFYPVVLKHEKLNRALLRAFGFISLHTSPRLWNLFGRKSHEFIDRFRQLYSVASELQGTSTFIDGQKNLFKVMAFIAIMGPERIRAVHLIRDPRSVYYSCIRRNGHVEPAQFGRQWQTSHARIMKLMGSLEKDARFQLLHEQLCAEPELQMDMLQSFLQVDKQPLIRPSNSAAEKHVIGNQMVMAFDGTVKEDRRWRDVICKADQATIIRNASPLFEAVGYTEQ